MSANYEINKSKLINDFFKCIGAFENCNLIYNNRDSFIVNDSDIEEVRLIKNGREEDLLSELGKVGEKAFKYILGLEVLRLFPNLDSKAFESFFKKNSSLELLAVKNGISTNDDRFVRLVNYKDSNNQKAHNFDYWFSVCDVLINCFSSKFKKYVEYNLQSEMLFNYCKRKNEFFYDFDGLSEFSLPFQACVFPEIINQGLDSVPYLSKKYVDTIISVKRETIRKSGDMFTRFRYASNNDDNVVLDLDECYETISNIVSFVKIVHQSGDNLNFDLDIEFAKKKALELSVILNVSRDEIINLFGLGLHFLDIMGILFDSSYSFEIVDELLKLGVKKNDLLVVISQRLYPRDIIYFKKIGVTDYYEMRKLIDEFYNDDVKKDYIR